jgi:mannitol/fructose-specific phosphotransferase system IIA component (Ntr-type)
MPIFNLLFFGIIGSSVRLETFSVDSLALIIGYVILRTSGKVIGNHVGCKVTGQDPKITASLPKLMLPQAGMAAVETILVMSVLKGSGGEAIFNTVIPAIVVFELGGAYLSERTLLKWKTWTTGEKEALKADKTTDLTNRNFNSLVKDRAIVMHATTKAQAVFELSCLVATEKDIKDISIITNPILEREKLSTTGLGKGIAFPHCRSESVDEVMVVCGVLENAIDWNAFDKIPVNLLFLIVSPNDKPELHLEALKAISTAISKPGFSDQLRTSILQDRFQIFTKELEDLDLKPV